MYVGFQNLMANTKAMELDLDNEIEKTKQEGTYNYALI